MHTGCNQGQAIDRYNKQNDGLPKRKLKKEQMLFKRRRKRIIRKLELSS